MKRSVVGVIGHVDHGKTALVRALTGMETDRLAEEQARGISIALGFAHFAAGEDTLVDLIDMPGHERFVRTMISGATGIDAVLLVVAANEGVRPQTREHLDIAALLGIRRAVVAISKADLVGHEEAALVAHEAAVLLARLGMAAAPAILTSVQSGEGTGELREALARLARTQEPRSADGDPWLPIDRAFSIAGHGAVATGTLRGASLSAGERLHLLPGEREVRVRALQVHGANVAQALPGQRVAVNLRDVSARDLQRGMALGVADALTASEWVTIAIRSVEHAPPLRNGMRLRALCGAQETDARLRLLDREVLEPGDSGLAQLHLADAACWPAREHVILRIPSPAQTVAGGAILEPVVRRLRRHDTAILARLDGLRTQKPVAILAAEIEWLGRQGTSLSHLARLTALASSRVAQLLADLPVAVTRQGLVFRNADLMALLERVPALLGERPLGLSRNQMQSALPGTRAPLLDEALRMLALAGTVARRGSQFVLPDPARDAAAASSDEDRMHAIAEALQAGGLTPPNPSAILIDAQSRRAVDRLLKQGAVVRAVDKAKGREMLFHRDAITVAKARLAPLLEAGEGLLVTEIAATLGISRKFAMPLVDHLDGIRFTRRDGDRRWPGTPAA